MHRANRIEALRNASQLSRPGVADRLGVSERTVYRWEQGHVAVPDHQKLALADLFGGISIPFMMGWEDEPNGNGGERERSAA